MSCGLTRSALAIRAAWSMDGTIRPLAIPLIVARCTLDSTASCFCEMPISIIKTFMSLFWFRMVLASFNLLSFRDRWLSR